MVFEADAEDYSPGNWPSRTGQAMLSHSGSPTLTSAGGVRCVRFDADNEWIEWNQDINPDRMSILTLTATFYVYSIPNNYGWLFGDENGGCDRYLLIHDHRVGSQRTAASCQNMNQWNSPAIRVGQWNHMVAYYNQGARQSYAVVNGVKSSVRSVTHNNGNRRLRLGSPWGGHTVNACVTNVKAYNRELTAAEIASAYAGSPAA